VEVSEQYGEALRKRQDLEILSGPYPMPFDGDGNLKSLGLHGTRKADL